MLEYLFNRVIDPFNAMQGTKGERARRAG